MTNKMVATMQIIEKFPQIIPNNLILFDFLVYEVKNYSNSYLPCGSLNSENYLKHFGILKRKRKW